MDPLKHCRLHTQDWPQQNKVLYLTAPLAYSLLLERLVKDIFRGGGDTQIRLEIAYRITRDLATFIK
jgi:hypothetical protein